MANSTVLVLLTEMFCARQRFVFPLASACCEGRSSIGGRDVSEGGRQELVAELSSVCPL